MSIVVLQNKQATPSTLSELTLEGNKNDSPWTHVRTQTLQHAATRCSTLQHAATHCNIHPPVNNAHPYTHTLSITRSAPCWCDTATRCNTLQHAATRCSTLQHAAARCNTHPPINKEHPYTYTLSITSSAPCWWGGLTRKTRPQLALYRLCVCVCVCVCVRVCVCVCVCLCVYE